MATNASHDLVISGALRNLEAVGQDFSLRLK